MDPSVDRPAAVAEPAPQAPPAADAAPAAPERPGAQQDTAAVDTGQLSGALDRLVDRGVLDRSQAGAVLREVAASPHPPAPHGLRRIFGEIAGYLGASFVIGATLLFLSEEWTALGRAGRFSIIAGMAVILFACGLAVRWRASHRWLRQPADGTRRRLSSTLFTGAAAAASFAAYVSLETSTDNGTSLERAAFAASVTGLAVVLVGYLLARSAFGQLGLAVAAFAVYATLLALVDVHEPLAVDLGILALGILWAALAWRPIVAERRFAMAVAAAFALFGAQMVVVDSTGARNVLGYALTALVAACCFVAYAKIREWIVLAGGVIGAALVVPEALYDLTDGSLGASGAMLAAGVTLLAGSLAGLRIRKDPAAGH